MKRFRGPRSPINYGNFVLFCNTGRFVYRMLQLDIRVLETHNTAKLTETTEQERKRSFVISGAITVFGKKKEHSLHEYANLHVQFMCSVVKTEAYQGLISKTCY
jgi:hypothetical protein